MIKMSKSKQPTKTILYSQHFAMVALIGINTCMLGDTNEYFKIPIAYGIVIIFVILKIK